MTQRTCCNHGCNQGRSCPQRSGRAECHVPCSAPAQMAYPFAPGVIQGAEKYDEPLVRMETLGLWLWFLPFLVVLAAAVAVATVYINLKGLLP